jgi:hypothetical protein
MAEHTGLLEALAAVQAAAPKVTKGETALIPTKSGKSYKYSYADLASILAAVRPLLTEAGLVWSTFPTSLNGQPALRHRLSHVQSNEMEEDVVPLMVSHEAGPQDLGSAITYMRRYALVAVLDLVVDDDDGGKAQEASRRSRGRQEPFSAVPEEEPELVDLEQIHELQQIAKELPSDDIKLVLTSCGIRTDRGWSGVPKDKAAVLAEALAERASKVLA